MDTLFQHIGLNEKEARIYRASLSLGPASVRKIAETADVNRTTAYDALKRLIELGLVAYYHKEKRQYFVAEDPDALLSILDERRRALDQSREAVAKHITELRSMTAQRGRRSAARAFEGARGIRHILEDVLRVVGGTSDKSYRVYSSSTIRDALYDAYAHFTDDRIARDICVRVISIGPGGADAAQSERRWLTRTAGAPNYFILYGQKLASISLDSSNRVHGVILEDAGMVKTQAMIFDSVWNALEEE